MHEEHFYDKVVSYLQSMLEVSIKTDANWDQTVKQLAYIIAMLERIEVLITVGLFITCLIVLWLIAISNNVIATYFAYPMMIATFVGMIVTIIRLRKRQRMS